MSEKFFVDSNGKYLGAFDGPNGGYWNGTVWGDPPAGATTVPSQPPSADSTYTNGAWVLGPNGVAAAASAQLDVILGAGITITSTGTPALNGVYAVDSDAQNLISGTAAGIAARNRVPGGGATFGYGDITEAPHNFSATNFLNLAAAIEDYVYNVYIAARTIGAGGSATFPPASATIA